MKGTHLEAPQDNEAIMNSDSMNIREQKTCLHCVIGSLGYIPRNSIVE